MADVLAIDAGGTRTRYGIVNESGTFVVHGEILTDPHYIDGTIWPLEAALHAHGPLDVDVISVAVAGNIEDEILTGSGNLPGWKDVNLRDWFGGLVPDKPVTLLNDCAAAALGEFVSNKRPLVYVGWGTGIGVGVVTGTLDVPVITTTEFGHMVIYLNSEVVCGCGGTGHLEALTCGRYLAELCDGDFSQLDEADLHDATVDMAVGLRNISCAFPGLPIVVGGGVIQAQPQIFPELQRLVAHLKAPAPVPTVALSSLSGDGGLIGAAHAARHLI